MEGSRKGKMWLHIEKKGEPSKRVTLRAMPVLAAAQPESV